MPPSRSYGLSAADSNETREPLETGAIDIGQFRLPNLRSPAFLAEAKRQSLAVAQSPHAAEEQAFIDSISTWTYD